ncbi:glycosyltransferase family 2 protein [Sedimentisphaera salicampi]|uniref:Putative glycosyltransferase YkoT n=1 Tax=Sedimentisphaera salicampi TaxID=1941349 RepID=A0A1W6LKN8_9BACT|nr:glycosyltransferase family 2 protein [Sedimentisphaera salicampi]ARN56303.1 putative glycosyltransferase YkoT [Sedimentisphaera salicampi]
MKRVAFVIPCYNEEQILNESSEKLVKKLIDLINSGLATEQSFILFVDDGSFDKTWDIIYTLTQNSNFYKGLKLSNNFGHQAAILTGMEYALEKDVDCAVTIDADLQDDISVINEMFELFNKGSEIIYGIRDARNEDSFFKRNSALLFYKLMNLMGANVIFNHADFRLVGSKALKALKSYNENCLFLRGIFPHMGFKTAKVFYGRKKREAGYSQYTLKKMLKLALNGIVAFSAIPLRFISALGFLTTFIALGVLLYALCVKITGNSIAGWASIVIAIVLFGGVQLLCLGIIGEYLSRVYIEVKRRPRYIIDEVID